MDNACSRHMIAYKIKFLSLEEKKGGLVAFGGGKKGQIKGIGTIRMNDEYLVEKVYSVESLKHNLLRISQH